MLCVAAVLASLGLVPPPPQDANLQQELQRAIELIQEGEFAAAAGLLETITAGRDDVSSEARDLAAAYLYLGIARLYLTGEDEAREAFHEAQRRDPAFEPATAELPRRVIEVWGEARDLASVVVVTVPEGAEVAVGGLTRGHAPVSVAALPPGDYRVTISLDGYAADSRVLTLARGEDTRLEVVLAPLTPLAPPPADGGGGGWWKWALPAGGAAAAVPLLRGGNEPRPRVATPVPPSAPAAPTLTPGDGQLGVSWTPPADNGAPIDDYDVRYRTANGNWTELPDSVQSTATSTSITGLANGTEYQVQVRAGNRAGDGTWSASGTGAPVAATGDRAVLVDLYNATNGPNWTDSTNWNSSAPLGEWHGVNTDGAGRVTGLYLAENRLSGPIPSSLGNLTRLESLTLYANQLTGSIPPSLGSITRLRSLNLSANQLTGSIPSWLGDLARLDYLDVYGNQLTGSIPSSLGDLTRLVNLWLGGNQLSGMIPASLGNLTRLERLGLEENRLTGSIPSSLGDLTRLQELKLDGGNELSGPIPASLGSLTVLEGLGLGGNQLSGSIPASLGSLTRLERLELDDNQLSGSIPASLGDLTRLEYLGLRHNDLNGSIPPSLGNLTNLRELQLDENDLTGSIPPSLGNLANLTGLFLYDNTLTGSIPSSLRNLKNLNQLALDENDLSGTIPPFLGNLANLSGLWLNGNDLTGLIPPELANLTNLEEFWLSYNRLSGSIPDALCGFEDTINPQQNNVNLPGCGGSSGARSLEAPLAPAAPAPAEAPAGLRVTWTAPEKGGSAVTGYDLQYRRLGETDWVDGPAAVAETTAWLVELAPETAYEVRVRAGNDAGSGPWSEPGTGSTGASASLTARLNDVPASHDGEDAFTFTLAFSEDVPDLRFETLRDEAFHVTGGTVRGARRRAQGGNQRWEIGVEPDSHGAVTIRLPETTDCDAGGAICTGDGRRLWNAVSVVVAGPVGISVADARVDENGGARLAFAVALSRAAGAQLTVDYSTADGSAQAGADYAAASGTLTFQAGESLQTVHVTVLDDAHDEGEETLTLTLSNASEGRLSDAEATGTIVNADPLPRALLARFGRTAAVHVVEHVEERMAAPREPGFEGRFAGREVRPGMEREMALSLLSQLGASAGSNVPGARLGGPLSAPPMAGAALGAPGLMPGGAPMGMAGSMGAAAGSMGRIGPMGGAAAGGMAMAASPLDARAGAAGGPFGGGLASMGLGGGNLLTGSAFALNRETRQGGILSFWSRGAQSSFVGREGALGLDGDVRTTMFGADYAKGPMVVGLSLAHSRGLGGYDGRSSGRVASSVTGLYPWLGYRLTERVSVWGVTGYGRGGMLLTPEGGPGIESGLSMKMAAAGTRGELVAGGADGFGLAFKADALWVGTAVEGVDGAAGRLAATAAAVSRVRTALEGSRGFRLRGRLSLTPSVEVGLRHDAGDAEQGAGMDIGGGVVLSDTVTGLAVDVRVRMLLVHEAEGFRERGMAVSLSYDPTPRTPLGLTARVAPSWGGQATSGAEALWGRETMAGMARGGLASGNRLDADLGYGLPVGSRFVGTPRVGFATSEYGRDYRLGYSLGALDLGGRTFELGVDAQRRENPMLVGRADNGVVGRATLGW